MSTPTIEERLDAVFAPIDRGDLAALARAFVRRDVPAGDALTREGRPCDALYVLHSGDLRVSIADASSSVELGEVPVGVPFGEVSFVDEGAATATVEARAPSVVLALSRDALATLRRDHPRSATAVLRAVGAGLAARVRRSSDKLDALTLGASSQAPAVGRTGWLGALRSLFVSGKER